jgi:hypothetical protein
MIFSHIQKPLGMRKTRVSKRICVQGVPLGTSWYYPYCCATVDTPYVTLGAIGSRTRTSASLTRPLVTPLSTIPQRSMYRGAGT